ncbi:MAG: serine/threonine protein kinase [Terriglobales bacterium]
MSDQTNKRIGDYELLNELGSGGMGRVWRVRNVITDRIEAMKVLLPDLTATPDLAARFQREIKLTASLDHPNIAALRTAFTADNQLYMVMEYVEGTTMATKLEMGPLSVNDSVNYISQVLSAVSYAHQRHIIHRDIKPANMMLTTQGVVKLMDFGIARSGDDRGLTMTGTTLGSIGYMSPEQVKGEPTDARSDLYSVGICLYEFVTGRRPFVASAEYSVMAAHLNAIPKPPIELNPGIPSALNEIILMSIAKEPAKRFQTADAFANALSSVPKTSAVAPTVPRAPLGGTTADGPELPAGFWEASPTMERPAGRAPDPPAGLIAPTVPLAIPAPPAPQMPATIPMSAANAATVAQQGAAVGPAPATPLPIPPPPQANGHRGLYMTLGALIVLAVLVVAGIYVPRISKTSAKAPDVSATTTSADTTSPDAVQPAPDASAPGAPPSSDATAQPAAPPDAAAASMDNSSAMQPAPAPSAATPAQSDLIPAKPSHARTKKLTARNNAMAGDTAAPAQGDSGMAAPGVANDSASLDELETEVDQLSNRAAAVNSGLDRLQQEQSAAGYGLRGDMVAHQASMKTNLFKAEEAMQHRDAARAKKYADLAGKDLEVLERFLGH